MRPLVSSADASTLRTLATSPGASYDALVQRLLLVKLNGARLVAEEVIPPSVVTMNAKVACWDEGASSARELQLVFPWDAAPWKGRISVLSRPGVALLGAVPGHVVRVGEARMQLLYVTSGGGAPRARASG